MNIVLITTGPLINSRGGVEKVFCTMANALYERGHHIIPIHYENKIGSPAFHINPNIKLINAQKTKVYFLLSNIFIKLRSLSFNKASRKKKRNTYSKKAFKERMLRTIKNLKKKPDIIIAFSVDSSELILDTNIPIITMLHGRPDVYFQDNTSPLTKAIEKSDVVQVLRPEFINILTKIAKPKKVVVIPNFVIQTTDHANLQSKKIIHVGRLSPEKRQLLLIKAFSKIALKQNWTLELWGDTQYDKKYCDKIISTIKELKLESKVIICGTSTNIKEELKKASIFAFPSEYEGFPLALTEAMAIGLPVIGCKNCSSVNTLIRHNINGLLCEDTPDALSKALEQLINNPNLRLTFGAQGKEDMKEFAPQKIWDQWEDLIYSIKNTAQK